MTQQRQVKFTAYTMGMHKAYEIVKMFSRLSDKTYNNCIP